MRKIQGYDLLPPSIRKIAEVRTPGATLKPDVYECENSDEVYREMKRQELEATIHIDRRGTGRSFLIALGIAKRMTTIILEGGEDSIVLKPVLYFSELSPDERRWAIREMTKARKHATEQAQIRKAAAEAQRSRKLDERAKRLGIPDEEAKDIKKSLGYNDDKKDN